MPLTFNPATIRIGIIGLGYVGLPLAVEFARKYPVVGFDVKQSRIEELRRGEDSTREVDPTDLRAVLVCHPEARSAEGSHPGKVPNNCHPERSEGSYPLHLTSTPSDLAPCTVFIITVPTPIDRYKRPDLTPLLRASETAGKVLKPGDVVIYESTVYPGATEEDCVPVLEKHSTLKFNRDFHAGYSPERINPGDREHRLTTIKKITSGSTPEAADFIDQLYASIIIAGTHRASSIKVAEAAKVIENTQRDVNIALINELALICNRIGIDTQEVLPPPAPSGTSSHFARASWVGTASAWIPHLTHKAQELGYHPEVILAGRRIDDNMGFYVAAQVVKRMAQKGIPVAGSRILVMGLAFKENCPDVRNTRVVDIVSDLASYNARVDVYDPNVGPAEARHEHGISPIAEPKPAHYDTIVIAVGHRQFADMGSSKIRALGRPNYVLYDVKHLLPAQDSDARI